MVDNKSTRSAAKSSHRAMSNAFAADIAENNEDAVSRVSRVSSQHSRFASAAKAQMTPDYPEVHLVPCRWKRTGWKYQKVETNKN